MEGGPPSFPRDSTCPVVLGYLAQGDAPPFAYRAVTSYGGPFQVASARRAFSPLPGRPTTRPGTAPQPPESNGRGLDTPRVWAPPLSLATTRGISVDVFSSGYLDVSVPPGCPRPAMGSPADTAALPAVGCPIRISPDRRLLAATRGLSQLAASFIGSRRQGIHHAPLVA